MHQRPRHLPHVHRLPLRRHEKGQPGADLLAKPELGTVAQQQRRARDGHARVAERQHVALHLALHAIVEDAGRRVAPHGAHQEEMAGTASTRQFGNAQRVLVVHRAEGRLRAGVPDRGPQRAHHLVDRERRRLRVECVEVRHQLHQLGMAVLGRKGAPDEGGHARDARVLGQEAVDFASDQSGGAGEQDVSGGGGHGVVIGGGA
jgi:hypothetical protein